MKRIIIGISGATGIIYGVRILQILQKIQGVETHLVMSLSARHTLNLETNYSLQDLKVLADSVHDVRNIASSLSSGSFKTDGMVIVPCSMKTLSGIAHSYTDSLLTRAADVILKERRRLVLCIRETPLHLGHLRLMSMVAENGAVIMPLVPAFYHNPKRIEDILDQSIMRVLDQFSITTKNDLFYRWTGITLDLKR
ncbi:MAG: UbiX family flavin prenyltransferase [Candidatus Dasytiphilus stammeri]